MNLDTKQSLDVFKPIPDGDLWPTIRFGIVAALVVLGCSALAQKLGQHLAETGQWWLVSAVLDAGGS